MHIKEHGYETVRIRSPDNNISFIILQHASKFDIRILFDTGSVNNRKLIDIYDLSKEYDHEVYTARMSFHVFTHCDKQVHSGLLGKYLTNEIAADGQSIPRTNIQITRHMGSFCRVE